MKHTLKNLLLLIAILVFASCSSTSQTTSEDIITVENGQFIKNGKPYYFVGTNVWYGAILGSKGEGGDRERLARELDFLKSQGITNLRVAVGGEGSKTYKSKISPILQPEPGVYNEELLDGLDYLMYQLQERDMTAVLYLANAWEWSGGFVQYLQWAGEIDNDFEPTPRNWAEYRAAATQFVRSPKAQELLDDHIKFIVSRTNKYTNEKYTEDGNIFSWQLCNEPRAFSDESKEYLYQWIDKTSSLIRSLDPEHMISTGSEGRMGCEGDIELCERIHNLDNISYINAHMWSLNWGWVDKDDMDGTIDGTIQKCKDYISEHLEVAERINKPLVLEEFGLIRDKAELLRGTPTLHRDRMYKTVFDEILKSKETNGKFAGCNFWSWGGEAEQIPGKEFWEKGMQYSGDPAQEAQGLNSVYVDDSSTLTIIREVTSKL